MAYARLDTGVVGRNLATLAEKYPLEAARALYQEAEIEMKEAKRRTPVDTGALRGTGHVVVGAALENIADETQAARTMIMKQDMAVTLVFGGPAASYAIYVHEDLDAFHKVGQAKFLESVIQESAPHLARRVAARLSEVTL